MKLEIKRRLAGLRPLTYRRTLALLFLAYLFFVALAVAPRNLAEAYRALREGQASPASLSLRSVTGPLNDAYRQMMELEGPLPVNKGAYIDLNGLAARWMGQRYVNERIRLDNGHLAYTLPRQDVALPCERITALYRRQADQGKAFLFVLAPEQIPEDGSLLPAGYVEYAHENGDALLAALGANGVPVLDLRKAMRESGLDADGAFFATDHHWKPETGFWAFARIVEELTRMGAVPPVEPLYTDLSNYRVEALPGRYLGSGGVRTGRYFAGTDGFSVITPAFDTHLITEIPSRQKTQEGTFVQAALNWSAVETAGYYRALPYALYGYGNVDRMRYQNPGAPLDQRLLWLGDSFGNAVVPFMSLVFGGVEDLDMRHYRGDFARLCEDFQPDVAVLLICVEWVDQENTTYGYGAGIR